MEANQEQLLQAIKKAKEGEQASFNFLLDTFWANVYHFQLQNILNTDDAEDITIQTFSKAFAKIHSFNEDYQFKTWLIAISKNVQIDFFRKKQASLSIKTSKEQEDNLYNVIDNTPSVEDKIITEQNLAKLLQDIKQLKPKYQEVIQLRFFKELSYKEISKELNEPINNVKIKLLRAKKLLAAIIKKQNE